MSDVSTELLQLFNKKKYLERQLAARNSYARDAFENYSFAAVPQENYIHLQQSCSDELNKVLLRIMELQECALTPHPQGLRRENIFIWGGPTPLWGGSMEPDTSVKGAAALGVENVVYVYGPLNEQTLEMHRNCKRLICQITKTARIEGGQPMSDVECAEYLSRLSLKYPNIVGGIADDLVIFLGRKYSVNDIKAVRNGLKKYNPNLEMYGVVYPRELDLPAVQYVADCIDAVNLWFDMKSDIVEFEMYIEKCRIRFPGKKILLGVFMQDINLSDLGYDGEVMKCYLKKVENAFRQGKIQDIVFLGDREIPKYPELARTIREFVLAR